MSSIIDDQEGVYTRKIGLAGGATLTVSLPKSMAEEMDLKQGDFVSLIRRLENSFVVIPEVSKWGVPRKVVIESSPNDEADTVLRKVLSAYLAGCTVIFVSPGKLDKDKWKEALREVGHFVRFRMRDASFRMADRHPVYNTKETLIRVDVTVDYSPKHLEGELKKMRDDIIALQRNAVTSISESSPDYANVFFRADSDIDLTYLHLLRALKESVIDERVMRQLGLNSLRACLGFRHITKNLERIGDHSVKIGKSFCDLVRDKKGKTKKNRLKRFEERLASHTSFWEAVKKLSEDAISVFEDAIDYLFMRDYVKLDDLIKKVTGYKTDSHAEIEDEQVANKGNSIVERARRLLLEIPEWEPKKKKGFDPREVGMLTQVIDSIRRTAEYARGISEVALNILFWEQLFLVPKEGDYRIVPPDVTR